MFGLFKNKNTVSKDSSEIAEIKRRMAELEQKLSRSQAAYIQATINGREMDPEEQEYHNKYTKEINELREQLHKLQE